MHDRPASSRGPRLLGAAAVLSSLAAPSAAVDYALSAFGTLGWAQSNRDYAYQRFIDDGGTVKRDTLAGAQVDVSFTPSLSATLQGRIAPSTGSDDRWDARMSWAFLSWRPGNAWLLRAGKLRVPMYLNSENTDVGATFPFARLPTEMYSTALTPATDFKGLAVGWTVPLGTGDFSVDAYWGKANLPFRVWLRDEIPGVQQPHARFVSAEVDAFGVALTWRRDEDVLRLGLHQARARQRDAGSPLIDRYPFVEIAPGLGYYQTSAALPGPGVEEAGTIRNTIVTLGASFGLPAGLRVTGELAHRSVRGSRVAPEGTGYYLALLRPIGDWTPYVYYGELRSSKRLRDYYAAVNGNALPPVIPGAGGINAAQRAGADGIAASDQHSWAIGTAWRPLPGQALKLEFQRVRSGSVSALIDAPPGEESGRRSIHLWSLNYSFVF